MIAYLAIAWRWIVPVLTFGITLPVWAFLAVGLWLWLDRGSAVREAVNDAVTELVDGAELEAERARAAALQEILAEERRRLAAAQRANDLFAERLAETRTDQQELADEIEQMLAQPAPDGCAVDGALLERLRNR